MTAPRRSALAAYLRTETVGGTVLLAAAVAALVCANTPAQHWYQTLTATGLGPDAIDLHLSIGQWAQDGLLAVFFFVAGLELKRELTIGELADRKSATLPILAAVGGVIVPALICLGIGWGTPNIGQGWAIPISTDIAFALAVLALTGSRLPSSARAFMLALAVVDDLIAILVIAAVFTSSLAPLWLIPVAACLAIYALAQRRRIRTPWLYVPLALMTWWTVHESGIHATLAGVALALLTRVHADPGEGEAPAARLERRIQPWSAGLCVPLFAFFASGVPLDATVLRAIGADRLALGVIAGLLVGKAVGIFGSSWLAIKLGVASRPTDLANREMWALSVLGGIGFTVSLLTTELALAGDPERVEVVKAAVLLTSATAAVLGAAFSTLSRPRSGPP